MKASVQGMTSRKKSVDERIIVIVVEIVAGLVVFSLAIFGMALLGHPSHRVDYVVGSLALACATAVMFATAERWGGYVPGFLFLPGLCRSVRYFAFPSNAATPSGAAFVAVYSLVAIMLCWRFIPPRRLRATTLDRSALTAFALSAAAYAIVQPAPGATAILLIGLGPLLVASAVHRFVRSGNGADQPPAAPDVVDRILNRVTRRFGRRW